MPNFYHLCGISGSGKTTYAYNHSQENDVILDSDSIREELWGNAADQQQPDKVFEEMFRRTITAFKEGRNVYYCSTGLSARHRINLLKQLRRKFDFEAKCIICIAPVEICKERNSSRDRVVPEYVIERQVRSFQVPLFNEGWQTIQIVHTAPTDYMQIRRTLWSQVENFGSQNNSHHTLSLLEHCLRCESLTLQIPGMLPRALDEAACWHDVGKLYTQEYWPEKDNEAHYPGHAQYGAYLMLCMGFSILAAQLVCYHMDLYNPQLFVKGAERYGDELWDLLLKLHQCDVEAH